MKYCLNCRQNSELLDQAAEIAVDYRDRDYINTLAEKYEKPIILDIPFNEEPDWEELRILNIITKRHLMLRLHNLKRDIENAKELEIPFYFAEPVSSYYDLNFLDTLGVCYLVLEAPLFFDLPRVKEVTNTPIRAIPTFAGRSGWGFLRENNVLGTYIRPEDIPIYEPYISICEFRWAEGSLLTPTKEAALYRIYQDQKWPGAIDMIIPDVGWDSINRLIHPSFGAARLSCGQRCQNGSVCRLCGRELLVAEKVKDIEEYKKAFEENTLKILDELS